MVKTKVFSHFHFFQLSSPALVSHLCSAYNLLNVEGEATTLPFRLKNRYQVVCLLFLPLSEFCRSSDCSVLSSWGKTSFSRKLLSKTFMVLTPFWKLWNRWSFLQRDLFHTQGGSAFIPSGFSCAFTVFRTFQNRVKRPRDLLMFFIQQKLHKTALKTKTHIQNSRAVFSDSSSSLDRVWKSSILNTIILSRSAATIPDEMWRNWRNSHV